MEYFTIILQNMLSNEQIPSNQTHQISDERRVKMVDVVFRLSKAYQQKQRTWHLAVLYLDTILVEFPSIFKEQFSDKNFFDEENMPDLKMTDFNLAASCMLLASKFYEIDDKLILV